ncbi:hypothetical protein SAMN05216419_10386 [Nitrosomonas cryotolerans]|uniref:Uncharacterized protein n=1 Tax=Nitrosomonas cryotolerans ATCC 49181 TaxID=1131553 RepID=A0A1N6HRG1_9PROT|nr:hypothetical protein SAMN05216419_10386 [Nitrosomonas cryotolerans]SIO22362.1 hypothetical protein SAMN02743940_1320 [Nitrosomonas cryotolerans ATCC 49181]
MILPRTHLAFQQLISVLSMSSGNILFGFKYRFTTAGFWHVSSVLECCYIDIFSPRRQDNMFVYMMSNV